jgi:hypothetical protein
VGHISDQSGAAYGIRRSTQAIEMYPAFISAAEYLLQLPQRGVGSERVKELI